MNLIVGDYFRSKSNALAFTTYATHLITWLRSKSRILAHIPLAVLRAVITRWTAHHASYRRLLQLYPSLKQLAISDVTKTADDRVLVSGDSDLQAKAKEMVKIIDKPVFWHNIALYVFFYAL